MSPRAVYVAVWAAIMSDMSDDKERPRGLAGVIWTLEHAQDAVSVIVGVMLVALAVVVLVLGIVDFFRDVGHGSVEGAVVNLLNLVLLIAMIAVFVAALILVSRYDPAEAGSGS